MASTFDRRAFTRIFCDARAAACQEARCWQIQLQDISLRGLLAETPAGFDPDPRRSFSLSIILGEEEICMSASLRHHSASQIGFECDFIDPESAQVLRQLVSVNLGDDRLLDRELDALGALQAARQARPDA